MYVATTKDEGWRRDKSGGTSYHAAEMVRRPDNAADGRFSTACLDLTPEFVDEWNCFGTFVKTFSTFSLS